MARYASVIQIAGVDYSGCRGLLLDGDEFADSVKGSVEWAADATPHPQTFDTQFRGVQFGIIVGTDDGAVLISKVNQTLNAIKNDRRTLGKSPVVLVDSQYNINVQVVPDYSQKWYSYGRYSEGYVLGVTFRFIVASTVSVSLSS